MVLFLNLKYNYEDTYFIAPFKVGILHQCSVSQFSLEEIVSVLVQDVLENLVQLGVVVESQVIVLCQVLGFHAEGAHRLTDVLIRHPYREEVGCAFLIRFKMQNIIF